MHQTTTITKETGRTDRGKGKGIFLAVSQ